MNTARTSVAIAIIHRAGRWLVARRRHDVHLPGLWEFPGGKCETGESPEAAAVREATEECSVTVIAKRRLPSFEHAYPDRIVELHPVLCEWMSGEGEALGNDECRWVTLAELRTLDMPAANAEIIREMMLYA